MHNPYFSLVTPTLNIADYLPRVLNSVEIQSFRDFEHIFIDGNSTDGTWEILKEYKERNPEIKVTLVRRTPKGVFTAQNQGIKRAKGRYVNLLNADDYFVDGHVLRDVYEATKDRPEVEWLQGDTILERKRKVHIRNKYTMRHLFHFGISVMCCILPQATFMTPQLYKKYGYHKTHRKTGMDTDLFVRMSAHETIYFFDRKITSFTIRPESVSISNSAVKTWTTNWREFYNEYHLVPFVSGAVRSITKRKLRKSL